MSNNNNNYTSHNLQTPTKVYAYHPGCFSVSCSLLGYYYPPAARHQRILTTIIEIIAGSGHAEDACDTARAILNANPNCAAFVLYPLSHTSCDKNTCLNNLRVLQDRMLLSLGANLVSNYYAVFMSGLNNRLEWINHQDHQGFRAVYYPPLK